MRLFGDGRLPAASAARCASRGAQTLENKQSSHIAAIFLQVILFFVLTKGMREGRPLTIAHKDITRYSMTIPGASRLVITAAALAKGDEIFV